MYKCGGPAKPWLFFSFQYRNQQHLQQDQLGSTVNPKPRLSAEVLLSPGSIHSLPLTMHTSSASPVPYKNISPAKKIRNIKRLLSFQVKKMPTKQKSLSISPQDASSFSPPKSQSNLVVSTQSPINIPPNLKKMSSLNIVKS